jgi:hypothetical protein
MIPFGFLLVSVLPSPDLAADDEPPLVVVGPAASPPAVDGSLGEAVWETATEVSGFVLSGTPAFAREQTRVRLCHDDRALYLGFRCTESRLVAASQQAHLFKAHATGRDADVFADDCVEVFIGPPGSGTYYQFAANAAGGSYEAREKDSRWDCEWQWAAQVGEGEWTVEMTIPFSALGAAPRGDEWALSLAREQKPLGENSTWSGIQGAFHTPEQFGRMRFGDAPAIRVASLPGDQAPLRISALNVSEAAQVRLHVRGQGGTKTVTEVLPPAGDAEAVLQVPRVAAAAGGAELRWELTDAGGVFYRSPWVRTGGAAHEFTLAVRPRKAQATVLVNGEPVAGDERGWHVLTLNEGMNAVGIDCQGVPGEWSVQVARLADGRPVPFADGWKASTDPPAGWATAEADVSRWPFASRADGAVRSPEPSKRAVFHRQLFVRGTPDLFWPMQPKLHLPRGSRQRIYPLLGEAGTHACDDFTYVIELPRPLRLVASDRVHGSPVRIERTLPASPEGRQRNAYAVRPEGPVGGGFQLLAHWRSADGDKHYYEPVLDLGGTFDWRSFEGTATAPSYAAECGVLLLKWQKQDITGEMWFDDVTMRAEGDEANLVPAGTFDEPQWEGKPYIDEYQSDGDTQRSVHIVARPGDVDRQQGVWVTEPHVPVTPGQAYVFTVRAKATDVRAPLRQPRACLLVDVGEPSADELVGYAHWEADGGHVYAIPQSFPIHMLSPLAAKRPANTRFIACYYGDRLEDEACNRALAENVSLSGVTSVYGSADTAVARHWPGEELPEFILPINWHDYHASPVAPSFLEEHPESAATQKDGKTSQRSICPIALLDQPSDFLPLLREWLKATVVGGPYRHLDWDHETPVWQDGSICFDERCLGAFREFAGLPADAKVTRETVVADHEEKWIRFRCHLNARMAGVIGEMLREIDPELLYSVYSGFQSPRTRERYGVDWEMMAPQIDLGIAGYNGGRALLGETTAALGEVPCIGGEMYHENDRTAQYPLPTPGRWRLRLLRTLLNGGGNGVLVWWLPVLDGGGFWGISQVAALVAEHEPFFVEFQRRDELVRTQPALSADDLAVLVRGKERLVICMNGSPREVDLRLVNRDLPDGSVTKAWPDGEIDRSPRVLRARLAPDDVRAWWVGPGEGDASEQLAP